VLRLVQDTVPARGSADEPVPDIPVAHEVAQERAILEAEAAMIEAWYGKNAYSDFLVKHGQRPTSAQAAVIGRLLGAQVKARDGTMQPPLTAAEREFRRSERRRQRNEVECQAQVLRLRSTVEVLATFECEPSDVVKNICDQLDESTIREQLSRAVQWLNRFAEEWGRREETAAEHR
jgi:hypothetical protein